MKAIYLDMDGTIANFYGVPGWLEYLIASDTTPYEVAQPLVNMNRLARLLNRLRAQGYHIGIVSWTSKCGTDEFNEATKIAKLKWLDRHLHSVTWDEIEIIPYGFPKQKAVRYASEGILFDDEVPNRINWTGTAYDVENILEILKGLL
jgi:hydroxymethylpyrimidine pyrophosphatase-like HAD family hydrolase